MKVVMVCDFFNESLEYQENLLVRYYRKHGHDVTVLTSTFDSVFDYYTDRHDSRWPARAYEVDGAKIIKLRYRFNLLNRVRPLTPINDILERERPDLIYVHDIMPNVAEAVAYKKRHRECKLIMDYHADYSNSGRNWLSLAVLHGMIRKWYLDRARPHLSRIFPIVPASVTFLHEVYGVPYSEMEILPLGADIDFGKAVRERGEGQQLRRALGIPQEDTVVFTGGKLSPVKRTEVLIEAVQTLADPTLHVVVVGDSDERDAAYRQKLLELARNSPRIRFVGWLGKEDIYRYLDMANLAVFPGGQSILWQQAISMGLPLIVGDIGHQDISYLNAHRNIVILPKDEIRADRVATIMRSLMNDPEQLRRMAEGAAKVADESLNWDKLILRTLRYNQPTA